MTPSALRRVSALTLFVLASWCSAAAAPVITGPLTDSGPVTGRVGETVLFTGTGLSGAGFSVLFSNGTNPTVAATAVLRDAARGIFIAKVPNGAQTGNMKITVGGADSNLFHFRVDPGAFTQGTRTVSGKVTNASNGTAVSGVEMMLFRGGVCGNVTGVDFAATDPNGNYSLTGPDGTFLVFVFPPAGSGLAVTALQQTLSSTPSTLNVPLAAGVPVTGRVVEAGTLTPIGSARVAFDFSTGGFGHEEALTDPNGVFSLFMLPGPWSLDITPAPTDPHAHFRTDVVVSAPNTNLGDQAMPTGVHVSGSLKRQSDNSPLAGVRIRAFKSSPTFQDVDDRFTDGAGNYLLVVDPNSTYQIETGMSDQAPVANVRVENYVVGSGNQTLNLTAAEAALISGTVREAGTNNPIECLSVEAQSPDPNIFVYYQTRTLYDGTYRLRVDPSAIGYRVHTGSIDDQQQAAPYAFQYWNNTAGGTYFSCLAAAVSATTAGQATAGIDFTLPLSATLEGTISTFDNSCSNDIPFAAFELMVDDGQARQCSMGSYDFSYSGPGYRWIGLPPSNVVSSMRACLAYSGGTYDPMCFDGKTPPAFDPIVVAGGSTKTGVDFCLVSCPSQTWYFDGDHDGFGDPNNTQDACSAPPNYTDDSSDCDDSNPSAHPGVVEACNGIDDDCDATVDDFPTSCGIGACASTGTCTLGMDTCIPGPPGQETCNNADDNCNGVVDDNVMGVGEPCVVPALQGVCAAGQTSCEAGGMITCHQVNFPSAELCDNKDNNCDGAVDGFATSCGVGACVAAGTCTAGVDTCVAGTPTLEQCNNADDDCDGQVDEGDPGGGSFCSTGQAGVCAAGTFHCASGSLLCSRNVNPSAEVCDNLDNDCDGNVDGMVTQCGVGACAATGSCVAGASTCVPGAPIAETCNGADDDCDGQTDEGNPGSGQACSVAGQQGVCAQGSTTCQSGGLVCNQVNQPSAETCNNLDDDCDGTVDGFATSCGVGACAATGSCVAGVNSCTPGAPVTEICNGADDDCDGSTDEGNPGSGAACAVAGQQGVCAQGSTTCQGGGLVCNQVNQPSAETCNNLDDDCNGTVDGFATTCGTGACSRAGTCTAGVNSCTPGAPTAETCNNIDDDCNGTIDGFATACGVGACGATGTCTAGVNSCTPGAPSAETCNNIDDDCNGTIDGFATTCGVGACGAAGTCTAGVNSCTPGAPSTEICDTIDNDCDGQPDDVPGGCTLAVISPANGSVVNCSPGAPPPAIQWSAGSYDQYRVYVSWDPNFAGTKKFTSGDTWLKTTSWTMTAKKWAKACTNANPDIYIKIQGQDKDVAKSDPNRKIFGPVAVVSPN